MVQGIIRDKRRRLATITNILVAGLEKWKIHK